jgi:AcrR family transcriptional regulator
VPSLDGLIEAPAPPRIKPPTPAPAAPLTIIVSPALSMPTRPATTPPRLAPAARPAGQPATHLDRDQILHATATCLRELGYDATTIRRIAGMLGCAVGSIYRYFEDKRALLDAVAQSRFEPVAAAAESRQPVETSMHLYAQTALADPSTYRMMFWLAGGPDGTAAELPGVVSRVVAAWEHRLGDAERARRCWMLVHGAAMMGQSADQALAGVQRLLSARPAPKPVTPKSPAVVGPHAATASPSVESLESEDVCLL